MLLVHQMNRRVSGSSSFFIGMDNMSSTESILYLRNTCIEFDILQQMEEQNLKYSRLTESFAFLGSFDVFVIPGRVYCYHLNQL